MAEACQFQEQIPGCPGAFRDFTDGFAGSISQALNRGFPPGGWLTVGLLLKLVDMSCSPRPVEPVQPYVLSIHDAAAPFAQIGDSYGPTVEEPLVWVNLKVPTGTNAFFQAVDADGHVAATGTTVFIEGPTDDCL
ncbi:hypothetical protein DFP72DRAFT_1075805 [Ephemerocybe angulata]|uniref:Uncharacterized protein n=1 Tax=Ephemerocybe angulata TaxID=980116 RepID=A0A8H6HH98_9AGAR|nr:hypothetical protein DFP72DRAFT_1075805 [Tulosesus angulatus]